MIKPTNALAFVAAARGSAAPRATAARRVVGEIGRCGWTARMQRRCPSIFRRSRSRSIPAVHSCQVFAVSCNPCASDTLATQFFTMPITLADFEAHPNPNSLCDQLYDSDGAALDEPRSPHSLAQTTALDEYVLADLGEEALGLLLLVPDESGSLRTPDVASPRLCAALDDAPNLSGSLASLESAAVRIFCEAALAMLQQTPLRAPSPRPQAAPRPVSAPGHPVRYLTEEEKARLNAKYGQLAPPTAEDMRSVLSSGANCKMQ